MHCGGFQIRMSAKKGIGASLLILLSMDKINIGDCFFQDALWFFSFSIRWKSFFLKKFDWLRIWNAQMNAHGLRAFDIQWAVSFFAVIRSFGRCPDKKRGLMIRTRTGKTGRPWRHCSGAAVDSAGAAGITGCLWRFRFRPHLVWGSHSAHGTGTWELMW